MSKVRLLHGPCDPRDVEMPVSVDAESLSVRPMPFDVQDVYVVTDTFIEHEMVAHATGEYVYTDGTRPQLNAYRKELTKVGAGRAFKVKPKRRVTCH